MVAVSLKKIFFQAEDGIRDLIDRLVGSEMCIRDRSKSGQSGVHSHQVRVRPRGGPESPGSGEVQLWNTVTGSQFCPVEDHGQQVQVTPGWGPESPNPGEAQVGNTVTRSWVVSGADQNQQFQVWCRWQPHSPGPCEALVGNRVSRYMRS